MKLAPTAIVFIAGLETSSALTALSLARAASRKFSWDNATQQEVTRRILAIYGARKLRKLQEKRHHV